MKINDYYNLAFIENNKDKYFFMGQCYYFGYGINIDRNMAIKIYEDGANANNAKCMYSLAVIYKKDKYITKPKNSNDLFLRAFSDLEKEAQLGDAISQRMVSCYYLFGDRGVEQNIDEAKKWLSLSAANDDPEAQFNLAGCYAKGEYFEQNGTLAKKWYTKSASLGNTKALMKLKEMEEISYENE